jgi:hypothetical protein
MDKSLLLASVLAIGLSVGLTGCSSMGPVPLKPYKVAVNYNSIVSQYELETILSKTIALEHKSNKFTQNITGHYSSPSRLDSNTISYVGLNATFAHEFGINENGLFYRNDVSNGSHGKDRGIEAYCVLCNDYGFTSYINKFQSNLVELFNKNVLTYSELKQKYQDKEVSFNKLDDPINVSVVDLTGILPSKVINKISEKITISKVVATLSVDAFMRGIGPDLLKNGFQIRVEASPYSIDRYRPSLDKYQEKYSYDGKPLNSKIKIERVNYNYKPKTYAFNDNAISVRVKGGVIYIANKTNDFINIETLSCYYNQDIDTDKDINLHMPPKSHKSYISKCTNNVRDQYVFVSSKNQKVNYGFAVSYFIKSIDKRTTLFNTNDYSIDDFR